MSTVSTRWQSHSITEEFNKCDRSVTVAGFSFIHHKLYYKMDHSDLNANWSIRCCKTCSVGYITAQH